MVMAGSFFLVIIYYSYLSYSSLRRRTIPPRRGLSNLTVGLPRYLLWSASPGIRQLVTARVMNDQVIYLGGNRIGIWANDERINALRLTPFTQLRFSVPFSMLLYGLFFWMLE